MPSNTPIQRVVIAGGGTAGWITAATLSKCLGQQIEIRLIESEEIGTVGVGEATIPTQHFLHTVLDLDEKEFMQATQATFKLGISFENWRNVGEHYFHSFGKTGTSHWSAGFVNFWLEGRRRGLASDYGDYCLELRAAMDNRFAALPDGAINYAYHLDATRYAQFLRRFSENLGVQRIEGKIVKVHQGANEHITGLTLENGSLIEGDLFVDCTGMRSLLLGETLGVGYLDWSHWLPCDTAVAVQTASVGPAVPYTRSIAHPWGWQWRIPLQHRVGNGIVFSSRHISPEDAKAALLANVLGEPLREPRFIRFKPGQRDQVWKHNVVAIGLSSGFLEPLESTSIHLIQKGAIRLVQLFPAQGICASDIDEYNRQTQDAIETVRDFIILHYHVTHRVDSPLWRYCREMEVPPLLKHRIQQFRDSARVALGQDELFAENSWVQVMMGQGIVPAAHHPIARQMDDRNLGEFLGDIRKEVARTFIKLPQHQAFVDQFCPAVKVAPGAMAKPMAGVASNPAGIGLRLRADPQVQALTLATGAQVLVVDDFLDNPEQVVALAQAAMAASQLQPLAGHPYPGPQLLLPEALGAQLTAFFEQHCREPLRVGPTTDMYARLSQVTSAPERLDPRQRICHRDDTGLEAGHAMSAMVHYLFHDERLGGTVFFRSLMSEADTQQFRADASALDGAAFEARYGVAPGYMTQSNRYFEVIGRVPARWNRAVFYSGAIFHSGDIDWAQASAYRTGLGRLTVNGFFKSRLR